MFDVYHGKSLLLYNVSLICMEISRKSFNRNNNLVEFAKDDNFLNEEMDVLFRSIC